MSLMISSMSGLDTFFIVVTIYNLNGTLPSSSSFWDNEFCCHLEYSHILEFPHVVLLYLIPAGRH